jgi:hypothetical protein
LVHFSLKLSIKDGYNTQRKIKCDAD